MSNVFGNLFPFSGQNTCLKIYSVCTYISLHFIFSNMYFVSRRGIDSRKVRHILKFYSAMKEFVISWLFNYRILPNTRASPNRRAPPKFLDQVPEISSSKIYITLFNDRLNAVLTICLLHSMK